VGFYCCCDQRRISTIFAQTRPSRLSESWRARVWVLVRVSRLGDPVSALSDFPLAQARDVDMRSQGGLLLEDLMKIE